MVPNKVMSKNALNQKKLKETHTKKKRSKGSQSYKTCMLNMLKEIHSDIRISSKAMEIMNSFINDMLDNISNEASKLVRDNRKRTISERDIKTAVKLLLHGDIGKHAL
ncbi:histone H2B.1, partial [Tanacetum coccineum]